jgi:hypothetical protein
LSKRESRIYQRSENDALHALRQGEILCGLRQARLNLAKLTKDEIVVDFETHPFAMIITQDCDLESDFRARQKIEKSDGGKSLKPEELNSASAALLPSILFCQLTTAEELRGRADIKSIIWDRVKINKDERYHFYEKVPEELDSLGKGLPELGADFKRYFTIPSDEVFYQLSKGVQRRCTSAIEIDFDYRGVRCREMLFAVDSC